MTDEENRDRTSDSRLQEDIQKSFTHRNPPPTTTPPVTDSGQGGSQGAAGSQGAGSDRPEE